MMKSLTFFNKTTYRTFLGDKAFFEKKNNKKMYKRYYLKKLLLKNHLYKRTILTETMSV